MAFTRRKFLIGTMATTAAFAMGCGAKDYMRLTPVPPEEGGPAPDSKAPKYAAIAKIKTDKTGAPFLHEITMPISVATPEGKRENLKIVYAKPVRLKIENGAYVIPAEYATMDEAIAAINEKAAAREAYQDFALQTLGKVEGKVQGAQFEAGKNYDVTAPVDEKDIRALEDRIKRIEERTIFDTKPLRHRLERMKNNVRPSQG